MRHLAAAKVLAKLKRQTKYNKTKQNKHLTIIRRLGAKQFSYVRRWLTFAHIRSSVHICLSQRKLIDLGVASARLVFT